MNITGGLSVTLSVDEALSGGLESGDLSASETVNLNFITGTGAGQADLKWTWTNSLAAGASDTWTLSALVDEIGRTVAFARVTEILVETSATVDGDDLRLGGAASNAWTALAPFDVKSLGVVAMAATNATGWPVTPGSSDQLKIANTSGSNPVAYKIILIGRST